MKAQKGNVMVITGNSAAAYGAMLCKPDVATSYPITPMSEVAEQLSAFRSDGRLETEMVEVEGENSAMNVVAGASMAGGRTFTATSSWGLSFMYDSVQQTSGFRAPVVMVIANRESPGILAVSGGQQDIISVRDTGWIQVIVEEGQEILDTVIMAFRLAEDYDIQLPVMVNYDGFYLSYMATAVTIPEQENVDRFLAPLKQQPARQILKPGEALGCGTHGIELGFVELGRLDQGWKRLIGLYGVLRLAVDDGRHCVLGTHHLAHTAEHALFCINVDRWFFRQAPVSDLALDVDDRLLGADKRSDLATHAPVEIPRHHIVTRHHRALEHNLLFAGPLLRHSAFAHSCLPLSLA